MAKTTLCRLCVSGHEEYKPMFDENGQGNNIYEITLKYFDPMILTPDTTWDSTVICLQCWRHIDDFHSFQQNILKTQSNLQETLLKTDIKDNLSELKIEDKTLLELDKCWNIKLEDATTKLQVSYNDNGISHMDHEQHINEEYEDNRYDSSEEDDLKPLIYHLKKSKQEHVNPLKTDAEDLNNSIYNEVKTKKLRKSKSSLEVSNIQRKKRKKPKALNRAADDLEEVNTRKANKDRINSKTLEWDNFIAQWKHELECLHCTTTVESFTLLRKHYHLHHPKEKLYAKCCDRRFSKRFTLFEHIQLHLNPKVFECEVCGRCSTSSSNLAKHKKELHTEEGKLRPFQCNICQKNFTSKTNLRIHKEVHESSRDHVCSECGKGFPSENRRKIHERMVHNADRICDQCGKSVHGIYALRKHLLEHKGVAKTKWPCEICGTELNSHSSRKRHKQMKHNDGTTAYICSECGKSYTSEPALMSHKRVAHAKELNFKCNYCEKAFKTPRNLREHTATHTGIDIYQCPHCPRTFKMSSNMHHHRKKVHPKEWAEGRINKRTNKVNLSLVANEVVI